MGSVTLNIDLGERSDEPDELYRLATQANIACGGHAGDESTMRRGCVLAIAAGAKIAAHPSYPDVEGFGRRSMTIDVETLRASIATQCAALREAARREKGVVRMVKAHGALYHDLAARDDLARAFVGAAIDALGSTLDFVGPPTSRLAEAVARERAARYVPEAFADRRYEPNGHLRARSEAGALIVDPQDAASQALALASQEPARFGTVCVHGDGPNALEVARAVRAALENAGLLR